MSQWVHVASTCNTAVHAEADKAPVAEVAKKYGVSDVTIHAWRKRFRQMDAVDVKRLRQLETQNGRLKKLLTERLMESEGAVKWTRCTVGPFHDPLSGGTLHLESAASATESRAIASRSLAA